MRINIPLILTSLQDEGYHLLVKGSINGIDLMMVLDTGASRSCFDINFLKKNLEIASLKENESMTSGIGTNTLDSVTTKLEQLIIGDLTIEKYVAVGIDMSHIHHAYEMVGVEKVDGILGGDILLKHRAVIDYRRNVLTLNSRPSRRDF